MKKNITSIGIAAAVVIALTVSIFLVTREPEEDISPALPQVEEELRLLSGRSIYEIDSVSVSALGDAYTVTFSGEEPPPPPEESSGLEPGPEELPALEELPAREEEDRSDEYGLAEIQGVPLDTGRLEEIIRSAADFQALRLLEEGVQPSAEYGFLPARASVEVRYRDGSSGQFLLGDEAPGGLGTYCLYNENLYLTDNSLAASFLYGKLDLVSLTVTDLSEKGYQPDAVILSGSARPQAIHLQSLASRGEGASLYYNSSAAYEMTAPQTAAVDSGAAWSLSALTAVTADSAAMVHPSAEDLAGFGLDDPYSQVEFTVGGERVTLLLSLLSDGTCFLYRPDLPVVFKISADQAPWAYWQAEDLLSKTVFSPDMDGLSAVTLTAPGRTYAFTFSEAEEQRTVSLNGNELKMSDFRPLYREMTGVSRNMAADEPMEEGAELVLSIRYQFTDPQLPDGQVSFYKGPARRLYVSTDGTSRHLVLSSFADGLIQSCEALLASGQEASA